MSPIIRVSKHDDHYVSINRYGLEDTRLSFKARGLLAYLLTKPDGWMINFRHLMKVGPDGEWSVLAALKELETCGYLSRSRRRLENGKFTWEQTLSDLPADHAEVSHAWVTSTHSKYLSTKGLEKSSGKGLLKDPSSENDREWCRLCHGPIGVSTHPCACEPE